jgi:Uma2 family endonuclease
MMPHVKKAELIEGIVYVPSPVRQQWHGRPHGQLMTWLGVYEAGTPGVEMGDNSTIRLDLDNEPQPDALLLIAPDRGGQTQIDADGYIAGAPEFVAEVASSSASYDLHTKLHVYRRNGVREYLVWRVLDQEVDWFVLRSGQYEPVPLGPDGCLRSEVFAGLWLDPAALVRGDLARVLAVVQQGLASAEHTAFVARLHPPAATP